MNEEQSYFLQFSGEMIGDISLFDAAVRYNIPRRYVNPFIRAGYTTARQVFRIDRGDLIAIRNAGPECLSELKKRLTAILEGECNTSNL